MRVYCIRTLADCVVQDESLVLAAATLGRKQVVELLIKATVGMDEEDPKVCQCDAIDALQSFAPFVLCLGPKYHHSCLQRWLQFAESSADVNRDLHDCEPWLVLLPSIKSINCIV